MAPLPPAPASSRALLLPLPLLEPCVGLTAASELHAVSETRPISQRRVADKMRGCSQQRAAHRKRASNQQHVTHKKRACNQRHVAHRKCMCVQSAALAPSTHDAHVQSTARGARCNQWHVARIDMLALLAAQGAHVLHAPHAQARSMHPPSRDPHTQGPAHPTFKKWLLHPLVPC